MPLWTSRLTHTTSAKGNTPNSRRPDISNIDLDLNPLVFAPEESWTPSQIFQQDEPALSTRFAVVESRGHNRARSMYDKMPSTVTSARKKNESTGPNTLQSDGIVLAESSEMHSLKQWQSNEDEQDWVTGVCATCGTKVKWPRNAHEFRCAICLMVNDLLPSSIRHARDGPGQPASHSIVAMQSSQTRPMPFTVERNSAIITRCIDSYLAMQLRVPTTDHSYNNERSKDQALLTPPADFYDSVHNMAEGPRRDHAHDSSPSRLPEELSTSPSKRRPEASTARTVLPVRSLSYRKAQPLSADSMSTPSQIPRKPLPLESDASPGRNPRRNAPSSIEMPPPPSFRERSHPSPSPPVPTLEGGLTEHDTMFSPAKSIFKPMEDYIAKSFSDLQCLNHSFATARLRNVREHVHEEPSSKRQAPPSHPRSLLPENDYVELDPKMLLLGDFAENGTWWAGRDERYPTPERKPSRGVSDSGRRHLVESRSPLIHWAEVNAWYNSIITAGMAWVERAKTQRFASNSRADQSLRDKRIYQMTDIAFAEARDHLQRALLRAMETLLKRPGRLAKSPDDMRFLLILLANPLLYPDFVTDMPNASTTALLNSTVGGPGVRRPSHSGANSIRVNAWDKGHAFSIVKRILGLLSNLGSDCQRHLSSWLARYDEEHLYKLLNLTQGFITHRLKRQHGRTKSNPIVSSTGGLIPNLSGTRADTSAQLHAALGLSSQKKSLPDTRASLPSYTDDWQVKAAAKMMSLIFSANKNYHGKRTAKSLAADARMSKPGSLTRNHIKNYGQPFSTSAFYNSMVDLSDLILDYDMWESNQGLFAFCQYPCLLSVGAKIRIMEHDAKRQMENKAREAFFDSILKNKALEQYLVLKVRRECLVEDSLRGVSEAVGAGQEDIKKGLKVQFMNEEGVDAGGLRKEWFLLLTREIFDPLNDMFIYDEESRFCYFNPHSYEPSDQFFLVGALLGLAIYNSIILDVALPPFTFKKLLLSGPVIATQRTEYPRPPLRYSLDDLAEYRPSLSRGLRQLLDYNGDVQSTFCRDFVIEVERYGQIVEVPLCPNGGKRPVTNANRAEFVDLYVRYLLDVQVARQFEPFKRGFYKVCGGNALSLFQPEEIELLVRGSDEPLDVLALKGVAVYEGWKSADGMPANPAQSVPLAQWFWNFFENASASAQRRILGFITGSDRVPAMGAANVVIKISFAGPQSDRYPIARTCFNQILLFDYASHTELEEKLWRAVTESEGFGLK